MPKPCSARSVSVCQVTKEEIESNEDKRKKRLSLAQLLTTRVPLNQLEANYMAADKAVLDAQRDHFLACEWGLELQRRLVRSPRPHTLSSQQAATSEADGFNFDSSHSRAEGASF